MSYAPLSDTFSDIVSVTKSISGDPYLPEFACQLKRLSNLESGKPPGNPCRPTPRRAVRSGIGLRYAVKPLKLLVYQKQHPWFAPLIAMSTVGLVFMLGYTAGKGTK